MNTGVEDIWVYLAASPLLGLVLTLVVFVGALAIYRKWNHHPLLNPVALSILVIILVLFALDMDYADYFEGAQFIHFLLGPATVALALPLYQYRRSLITLGAPILLAVAVGLYTAGWTAYGLAQWFGMDHQALLSLIPKSVTAPVAMAIAEKQGGLATLTATFVVVTGVMGAMLGPLVMRWAGVQDERVIGVAMGVSAHGLGTAKAMQISAQMGAFAGLAMALSALISVLIYPFLY